MDPAAELHVRPLAREDRAAWGRLYAAYAAFYAVDQSEADRDRVWAWLTDAGQALEGLVAEQAGQVVGIAHHRLFLRPLAAGTGLYLDDLFVEPEARGRGAGAALLAALGRHAAAEGHAVVRWITAPDNHAARALYDRAAAATPWVTYDLSPPG